MTSYDHVDLKTKVSRIGCERVKKGRNVLNAVSGIIFIKGYLTIKVCIFVFWSLVVPIVTFAA